MTDAMISLIAATALLLGSPGPAPLALAGTSATFGVRRGLPFLFGVLAGLLAAIIGAVAGLVAIFQAFPSARIVMQVLGAVYICYVALKIATAPIVGADQQVAADAPRFIDGFILNLLNPKAYAAFLAVFSQFLLPMSGQLAAYFVTAIVCLIVAAVVDVAWLLFGGVIGPLFQHPQQARVLRVGFAVAMVSAVLWALAR